MKNSSPSPNVQWAYSIENGIETAKSPSSPFNPCPGCGNPMGVMLDSNDFSRRTWFYYNRVPATHIPYTTFMYVCNPCWKKKPWGKLLEDIRNPIPHGKSDKRKPYKESK